MYILSNILLHKIDKMKPFLLKHCKEGGAITSVSYVRQLHLFALHFAALKVKFSNQSVSIIVTK